MELLLGFLLAMSVTIALIPPLMHGAGRLHVLDMPSQRKVHAQPIPRVGGIAMAAGTLLALLLWGGVAAPLPAFCTGIVILLAFGVWDDRVSLGAGTKFLGQLAAALVVMLWGDVSIGSLTLAERIDLPQWVAAPLTLFFIVGVTNAINLADGLDGLAGGTTLLSLCAVALLAWTSGSAFVGSAAVIIVGAVLGFLRFNTHPARVFMGDSGSQILGFSVAVLAVVLTQDTATPLSSSLPLLLLGLPIIDTLMVMTQRMLAGHSPFRADRNHTHHRLLALGLVHHEAVVAIYLLQAVLFLLAWFMRFESDIAIVATFIAFASLVIGLLFAGERCGWRLRDTTAGAGAPKSALQGSIEWLRSPGRLPKWAYLTVTMLLLAYFAAVALACGGLSADLRFLAIGVAMVAVLSLAWRRHATEPGWVDMGVLYVCAVLAVYLEMHKGTTAMPSWLEWTVFILMAMAIAVRFRLSSDRRFKITPLDVLVVFIALVIPNLPGSIVAPQGLGASVGKLIVLFYAVETLSAGIRPGAWRWPGVAATAFLLACLSTGAGWLT
jgi:UDP-GlcNAc:undecaprenyl-phosphate GlcNAc-1-phosphate transferase